MDVSGFQIQLYLGILGHFFLNFGEILFNILSHWSHLGRLLPNYKLDLAVNVCKWQTFQLFVKTPMSMLLAADNSPNPNLLYNCPLKGSLPNVIQPNARLPRCQNAQFHSTKCQPTKCQSVMSVFQFPFYQMTVCQMTLYQMPFSQMPQ